MREAGTLSPSPLGEGLWWGLATGDALAETRPTPCPSPEGEGFKR